MLPLPAAYALPPPPAGTLSPAARAGELVALVQAGLAAGELPRAEGLLAEARLALHGPASCAARGERLPPGLLAAMVEVHSTPRPSQIPLSIRIRQPSPSSPTPPGPARRHARSSPTLPPPPPPPPPFSAQALASAMCAPLPERGMGPRAH
jgi:hypothetical protein